MEQANTAPPDTHSTPLGKRQATAPSFYVVFHHRCPQSFSEIGHVVVVIKWPDHGKNFAGVFGHELLWIGVEENSNHCAPLRFARPQCRCHKNGPSTLAA
jgi:hypothetical protein